MFTWICPECGAEVQPSDDQCPRCADKAREAAAAAAPPPPPPPPPPPKQAAPPPPPAPQAWPPPGYPPPPPGYPPYPPPPGYAYPPYPPPPAEGQPAYYPYPPPPYPPQPQYAPPPPQEAAPPPPPPPPPPRYEVTAAPTVAAAPVWAQPPAKTGPPGWLVTLGVAAVLGAVLYGAYSYMGRHDAGSSAPDARTTARSPLETPPSETGAAPPSPAGAQMAKHVEITGIRITEDKKRAMLTVAVVNHSGADLAAMNGKIRVTTKDGAKTVATVDFKMANLAPYETKDYSIQILTTMRAYEMPDWQFLKAELSLK